jgi:PLP dependent protein
MEISERLEEVESRISFAAERSGRMRDEIKLLAVTKTHDVETIKAALFAGVQYIGENRVQEASEKLPFLSGLYREFHYIGHLQTNKINKLLEFKPALIHSIDNFHLAEALNKRVERDGNIQEILLQVNTSGEASKFGVSPAGAVELAGAVSELSNLRLTGLMTIGRFTDNEFDLRASFSELRLLSDEIGRQLSSLEMQWLSMGMSNDYELAIEEGANLIRLGTSIFGLRACITGR